MDAFVDTLFAGGGGTLVVIYMLARGLGKAKFRATLALVAAMLPFMLLGTWVGEKINARISHETFTTILSMMLMLSGASLLLN